MNTESKIKMLYKSDSIFSNNESIKEYDSELWSSMENESLRQEEHIELIASENYASTRILEAQGSVLTNKYAEGYPYDIIITENDPAFILDVLRNLRSGSALYCWYTHEYQVFENGLVSNVFERENVQMFTSSYVDYDDRRVKEFIKKFRDDYGRQPDIYAIEGYDNAKFHLQRLTNDVKFYRGIKKGFDYSNGTSRQNKFVELRKFEGLRWVKF